MEIPVKFSDQSLCEALELSYCNLGVLAAACRHTHTQGRGDTNGDCDDSIPAPRCGPNIEIIHFSNNTDCSEKTKENLKEGETISFTKHHFLCLPVLIGFMHFALINFRSDTSSEFLPTSDSPWLTIELGVWSWSAE